MKVVFILIGLLILGGVGFVILGGNETEEPVVVDEVEIIEETQETITVEDEEVVQETEEVVEKFETTEHVFTLDSFNLGYSETELRVKMGDTVTINLTNSDGFHDWVIDEFGVATDKIQTGGNTSVTFVAERAGTFEYYCSVGSHRANGMVGNLIVE
jgi:plastocyanin